MYKKQFEVESRVEFFKVDIQETLKKYKTIKKWAYILHDKDDTAPHYHIYLNFGNSSVNSKDVAGWFGLQESQVSSIRGRSSDMLLYLTHGNDSQQHKHQYSPSEVIANFDFETEISNAQILGDFEHFSYAEQLNYVNSLPFSEKTTAFTKLEKLWKLRCQWLSLQTERHLEVVFITGKGGTGKTYYAKKLLQSMGKDFCVSSSSNDPFQDYLGQKGMILDDLRDTAFKSGNDYHLEDFLKIIDNNTSSSVKSRFSNKVFNGDIIVITSAVPLKFWFSSYRTGSFDTLEQLYRRISCYVEMTKEDITVYGGVDDKGCPKGLGKIFENTLLGEKRSEVQKTDFVSEFEKICVESVFDVPRPPTQLKMDLVKNDSDVK